uniref:Uncharacterized protein n=1 Tax=Oryza brachyantha TaxID=4533 RepID=J3LWD1_ORYBR
MAAGGGVVGGGGVVVDGDDRYVVEPPPFLMSMAAHCDNAAGLAHGHAHDIMMLNSGATTLAPTLAWIRATVGSPEEGGVCSHMIPTGTTPVVSPGTIYVLVPEAHLNAKAVEACDTLRRERSVATHSMTSASRRWQRRRHAAMVKAGRTQAMAEAGGWHAGTCGRRDGCGFTCRI